jgi:hypothetical protein
MEKAESRETGGEEGAEEKVQTEVQQPPFDKWCSKFAQCYECRHVIDRACDAFICDDCLLVWCESCARDDWDDHANEFVGSAGNGIYICANCGGYHSSYNASSGSEDDGSDAEEPDKKKLKLQIEMVSKLMNQKILDLEAAKKKRRDAKK